jgi:hypothetical protein
MQTASTAGNGARPTVEAVTNLSVMALRLYVQLLHIGDGTLSRTQLKAAIKAKTTAEFNESISELYAVGLLEEPLYTLRFGSIPVAILAEMEACPAGDVHIRSSLVDQMREMDALPLDGNVNQPTSNAYQRRHGQVEVLRAAWRYLYPKDAAFPLVDANRLINQCGGSGEQVLDYMFTIYDAPHKKEVSSPRAFLRTSIENALGLRQKPAPDRGQSERSGRRSGSQSRAKPKFPWDGEKDQEIKDYAQRHYEYNPGEPPGKVYEYAKTAVRAK